MGNDITVVLNGYKRPHTLVEQYMAIREQEQADVKDIFYVQNTVPGIEYYKPIHSFNGVTSFTMNKNLGVWGRFYAAMNAQTEYVCVFDDDTIPGNLWLKNCLDTIQTVPDAGLLGTIGVVFNNDSYSLKYRVGWDNPNEEATVVDIVGHSWVFKRDMLSVFCRELPPVGHVPFVGEDIHFSHMIQKYTNLKTYVPPHPRSNLQMWGSKKGWEYGGDHNATAGHAIPHMYDFMQKAKDNGFKVLGELV